MESAEQGRTSLVLVRHKFGSSLEGGCMSEGLGWRRGVIKILKNEIGEIKKEVSF